MPVLRRSFARPRRSQHKPLRRYTPNQTCGPSKFLSDLGTVLPQVRRLQQRRIATTEARLVPQAPREEYEERHLQLYDDCPARYRYEVVDGLRGPRDASAYLKFHGCVRRVIAWIETQRQSGIAMTADAAARQLRSEWNEHGPLQYPYEPIFWRAAEEMVRRAAGIIAAEQGASIDVQWRLTISGRPVVAMPDRVTQAQSGEIIVQRLRTGRKTKNEPTKAIWAFFEAAGRAMFLGRPVRLEAFYPAIGELAGISPEDRDKSLEMYESAIAGIERGEFTPNPSRDCPSCPYYFICTSEVAR